MSLNVSEIFYSIQGESSYTGLPFIFIRLSGCNLRCGYCDTKYAYESADEMSTGAILEKISAYPSKNALVTGGEPLLQDDTHNLMGELIKRGYTVLLETNGSVDISKVERGVVKIVDIKCPDSGAPDSFLRGNISHLTGDDEVKFVLSSKMDYDFAKKTIIDNSLSDKCKVILSSAAESFPIKSIAELALSDGLDVRVAVQLHKYIFGDKRGV